MKWRDKNRFKQMKQKVILIFFTSKYIMRFSLSSFTLYKQSFLVLFHWNEIIQPEQTETKPPGSFWIWMNFLDFKGSIFAPIRLLRFVIDDTEKSARLLNRNDAHVLIQMASFKCCTVMWKRWKIPRGKVTVQYSLRMTLGLKAHFLVMKSVVDVLIPLCSSNHKLTE